MEEFHRICANHTNHQKSYYETNSALKFFRLFFSLISSEYFLVSPSAQIHNSNQNQLFFVHILKSLETTTKTGLWKFLWIKFDNLNNLKLVSAIKNRLALNHFLFDNMKKPNHNRNKKASWNAGAAHFDHFRSHSLKHSSKCNSLIMIWRYCFFWFPFIYTLSFDWLFVIWFSCTYTMLVLLSRCCCFSKDATKITRNCLTPIYLFTF